MTERLYYTDAYVTEFESVVTNIVLATGNDNGPIPKGHIGIELDVSCFYPTSGGQPFDTGQLTILENGEPMEVCDVIAETGQPVLHIATEPSSDLSIGMRLRGAIDWTRRYDHMQQHSSQHLLSHALHALLGYETVSVHFGATESTIDLVMASQDSSTSDGPKPDLLTGDQLASVERYVSDVVYRNVPVNAYFVSAEEIEELPLRRPPKVTGQIRVVEIAKLDYSACGGTHCGQTGELGPIKIVKQERQRQNVRITFLAGYRALADYQTKHAIATQIAGLFSNEVSQTPSLTQSLQEENRALEKQLNRMTEELLRYRASDLLANAEHLSTGSGLSLRLVAGVYDDVTPATAKTLVSVLQEQEDLIVLMVLSGGTKLTALFARGSAIDLHMGNMLRATLAEFGGGGGGREDFAQGGGLPTTTADAILASAVAQVQSSAVAM